MLCLYRISVKYIYVYAHPPKEAHFSIPNSTHPPKPNHQLSVPICSKMHFGSPTNTKPNPTQPISAQETTYLNVIGLSPISLHTERPNKGREKERIKAHWYTLSFQIIALPSLFACRVYHLQSHIRTALHKAERTGPPPVKSGPLARDSGVRAHMFQRRSQFHPPRFRSRIFALFQTANPRPQSHRLARAAGPSFRIDR